MLLIKQRYPQFAAKYQFSADESGNNLFPYILKFIFLIRLFGFLTL